MAEMKHSILAMALILSSPAAMAAVPSAKARLTEACINAFRKSNPQSVEIAGKKICDCIGPESKHQGAKDDAMLKEASAMEADPKHEFKDKHVRDAFRYCMMTSLDQD